MALKSEYVSSSQTGLGFSAQDQWKVSFLLVFASNNYRTRLFLQAPSVKDSWLSHSTINYVPYFSALNKGGRFRFIHGCIDYAKKRGETSI